jgi:quinoprotein glucose dehydrogenase
MRKPKPGPGLYLIIAASAVVGGTVVAGAQTAERSVWSGAYTDEQAARGKLAYAANCATCHGESLAGIDAAPPLTGATFLNNWNSTTAGDLFTRIKTTMPLNAPDTLSGKTVSDVEAYLFQSNGFPAGQVALPSNPAMMAGVKIVATKPGG